MDQLYSFIDVVALEPVRAAFARGEALVIFSRSMDEVIWSNGPGAAALGFAGIEEAIGADNPWPALTRRQIRATPDYPHVGRNKPVSIRLSGLVTTRVTRLSLSEVILPDGEEALLVAFPDHVEPSGQADALERAISGFAPEGQFVAILDDAGNLLAATAGFNRIGVPQGQLAEMAQAAGTARAGVVKRRLSAHGGTLPAGLARLGDTPALHFLIAIGDAQDHASDTQQAPVEAAAPPSSPSEIIAPPPAVASQPAADAENAPTSPPVRFSWRTDADGRFSALSAEFLQALGIKADAVVGRPFRDIAAELGFDADGEIAGLLERRDTWSGRSVLWPLAESPLRVPVDLAALPIYDRERRFEGFRGFGVARLSDAVEAAPASESEPVNAPAKTEEPASVFAEGAPAEAIPSEPAPLLSDEPPVTVDRPDEPDGDKVVRLSAHRQALAERAALSTSERSAFREIGDRLKAAEGGLETGSKEPAPIHAAEDEAPAEAETPIGPAEAEAGLHQEERIPAAAVEPEIRSATAQAPADEAASKGAAPAAALSRYDADKDEDLIARAAIEGGSLRRPGPASAMRAPEHPFEPAPPAGGRDGALERPTPSVNPETLAQPSGSTQTASGESAPEEAKSEAPSEVGQEEPGDKAGFVGVEPLATDAPPVIETPAPDAGEDLVQPELPTAPDNNEAISDEDASSGGDGGDGGEPIAYEPEGGWPDPEPEGDTTAPSAVGYDLDLINALPIAIIIHAGDRLDFANQEFFTLTGYDSLQAVAEAGGLEALFVARDSNEPNNRCPFLRTRSGQDIPVQAHLQSVPWGRGKSLMLSLRLAKTEVGPAPQEGPKAEAAAEPVQAEQEERDETERPSNVTRLPLPHLAPASPPSAEPDAPSASDASAEELARVRALLEEMRAIVDTATDGVILIDRDGQIRSISHPAEALFGLNSAEVEGRAFASLFAIESQRAVKDYLNGLTDNGVASVLNDGREVIGREAQGGFIPLFITIGRLPGDSGFCAVVREITQWKRAEEELTQARAEAERSSSQKSEFLARVSHEIRTPLNAIIGFSELMMEERFGPVGNERYRDYLRDINRSGNHVLDLVNDLLDISKIEAGEQELSYVAVSLNETLAEAVAIMQPQANRERVIIRSSFASRLPEVVADLRSVRQIALNLLSNAVRYTQAGGQVIVSTAYEASGEVVLRIRDTGVGMSSAEIDQALRPFKQVNALKRARGDGTGLGLPLTKAMVEANRARFVLNSRPGEGTLVEVTFPSTRVLAD